jgi:glycosyltransferase involved in cell wall biosynthesis
MSTTARIMAEDVAVSSSAVPDTFSTLRIAIVAPSLDILGGQGVQARSLAQALGSDGFEVLFIAVNPGFPKRLQWLRRIPVARTLLNQCLYLANLLKLRQVDVVHVFSASYWSFLLAPVPAIMASRWFGKPVILNYHSGEAEDHLANWGLRVHPWLRRADEIVVPSAYLQNVFARHGYRARVVRNIIDTSGFHYRERSELRPLLLSNRNLEAHYCIGTTLKAFALLRKQWPQARLKIAGYGSERARLEEWVRSERLGGVEFVGRIEPEAMPGLYDEADIFVNASVVDNQPISILEAFAAGLPVVSTPVGDIPAMLQNQQNGTLVPRNDPATLAAAIALLLNNPGKAVTMARRAREEVEQYTWAQVRGAWADVYRNQSEAAAPV